MKVRTKTQNRIIIIVSLAVGVLLSIFLLHDNENNFQTLMKPSLKIVMFWSSLIWINVFPFFMTVSTIAVYGVGKAFLSIIGYRHNFGESFLFGIGILYAFCIVSKSFFPLRLSFLIYMSLGIIASIYFHLSKLAMVRNLPVLISQNRREISLYVGVTLIIFPMSYFPELAWDATWYHLGSATHFLQANQLINLYEITRIWQMGLPNQHEVLQTFYLWMGGIHSAKGLSFVELLVTIYVLANLASKYIRKFQSLLLVITILLGIPVLAWVASHAYADMASIMAISVLLFNSEKLYKHYTRKNLLVISFLVGLTGALKFTSFLFGILLVLTFPLISKSTFKIKIFTLAQSCFFVIFGYSFTLINQYMKTGNPLFPYANIGFKTRYMNFQAEESLKKTSAFDPILGQNIFESLFRLPSSLVFHPGEMRGIGGPLLSILVILGALSIIPIFLRSKDRFLLQVWIVLFAWSCMLLTIGSFATRYLISGIPAMVILSISSLTYIRFRESLSVNLAFLVGLSLPTGPLFSHDNRHAKMPTAIGSLEYDSKFPLEGVQSRSQVALSISDVALVNDFVKSNQKVLDLAGVQRFFAYINGQVFDFATFSSPPNNGEWTLYSPEIKNQLIHSKIDFVITKAGSAYDNRCQELLRLKVLALMKSSEGTNLYKLQN